MGRTRSFITRHETGGQQDRELPRDYSGLGGTPWEPSGNRMQLPEIKQSTSVGNDAPSARQRFEMSEMPSDLVVERRWVRVGAALE
jgi:hypothetical protein